MSKTFNLSTLNLSAGTHSITVKARARGYADSVASTAAYYEVETAKIKYFIIGDTAFMYEAGMTWGEWISTPYNADVFSLKRGKVVDKNGLAVVDEDNNAVKGSDVISNACYYMSAITND